MTASILERVANTPPPPGARIFSARLDGVKSVELTELWAAAGRVAQGLRRLGVGRGDRVGIMASNSLEWVLLDLAAIRIGAVVAGLEPGKFPLDGSLLARYELSVVFTDRACNVPGFRSMAEVDALSGAEPSRAELPEVRWAPNDPVALKFTSGSTGKPKCLAATASSADSSISDVQSLFAHGPGDNLFVFLPLSLLQQRYWVYSALAFGHDVTISTYEAAFLTMGRIQPTVVMGVPAFFEAAQQRVERMADRQPQGTAHGSPVEEGACAVFGNRIRYLWTGSAPAGRATLEFFERCGLPIYEGYGLNETCIVTKNTPTATKSGSVGRPLPGKRVTIGADGVVCVVNEFPVASRYEYASPGDSERVFQAGGVVRTGDLGYLDEDGFLFLTGRADDVIVLSNGRKVVVRAIEEFMKQSTAVAECVLFCPSESRLVAVVSPAGQPPDFDAIHRQSSLSNKSFGHDEQITGVVVAREPFSVENDLLTSQRKPRRPEILEAYRSEIAEIRKGTHVH